MNHSDFMVPGTSTACCHVCGGNEFKRLYSVVDTNQGVPGKWDILQCQACGLGILDPMPSPEDISSYYQDNFYSKEEQCRFNPLVEALRLGFGSLRTWGLRSLVRTPGRVLDYGSGAGHFVTAMKRLGWDVASVDIANQDDIPTLGRDTVVMEGEKPHIDYPDNYFDVVSLWYVIEHVISPRETLKEVRRVLKPGGTLLLAQQDFASIQAKVFGPNWLILDPPRHLYQFDKVNLTRLCNEIGFSLKKVERASLEMGPFTILQSVLNRIMGNQNYLFRFLKNRKLRDASGILPWGVKETALAWGSIILALIFGPVVMLCYFLLLTFEQSDVFTLYYRLGAERIDE